MRFELVDRVLELEPERIVTVKLVTAAEEYLQDHFPSFPVLPGVLMLEAMVQAARKLVEARSNPAVPLVLGKVRALKYGRFVRPGCTLRVEVTLGKVNDEGYDFRGEGTVIEPPSESPGAVAVSGRFLLRPARVVLPEFVGTNFKH